MGTLIAFIKDYKKLTDEQKKQPIKLIFESFSLIGLVLFVIGVVIFDNLLLGNIAIILVVGGFVYDSIGYWKSGSMIKIVKALGLTLFILVFYIYFNH
ncbi:hypothetical protein I2483_17920 [Sporosarcina sp. E16_3]|uniref:hypothetical protein n=1 Tax=Sporosarcina sp. E16_3 TaxID=2789293 RepID=UPI001A9258D9|nr:hypothetical protein [Sporosarcina sp. E16_3]MBO0603546.1 hypothetical protein [Sporosarcina sp. E16_3]